MTRTLGKMCRPSSLICPPKLLLCNSHHRLADQFPFAGSSCSAWLTAISMHSICWVWLALLQCATFCWYFSDRACDLKGPAIYFQKDIIILASFGFFLDRIIWKWGHKIILVVEQIEHIWEAGLLLFLRKETLGNMMVITTMSGTAITSAPPINIKR